MGILENIKNVVESALGKKVDKQKFSGVWNAQRILGTYVTGKSSFLTKNPSDYDKYVAKQLQIVVAACLQRDDIAEMRPAQFAEFFERGDYLSPKMTDAQKQEFMSLMKEWDGADDYTKGQLESLEERLDNVNAREALYETFLSYRCSVERLLNHHAGVLGCNEVYMLAIFKTRDMYEKQLREKNLKLDRMLCLLLGEDYDKEIVEWELIQKYDYPEYTKDELREMSYEDW